MSHTIVFNVRDKDLYKSTFNNLEEKLKKIISNNDLNESIKITANLILDEINLSRNKLDQNFYSQNELLSFLSSISTMEKNVANLFVFARQDKTNNLIKMIDKNNFNYSENLIKYGALAVEVLEYLNEKSITINDENFNKYLEEVKNKKIDEQKIRLYINNSINLINETNLPQSIKKSLINEVRNITEIENIKDIPAIIESKNNEYIRMYEFINQKLKLVFKNQKFNLLGDIDFSYDKKNNVLVSMFNMKNDKNNTVQIKLDSNLNISYKLGNYIGHACEKTTEKIIDDLNKMGVVTNIVDIKRDFEYNQKSMSLKIDKKKEK